MGVGRRRPRTACPLRPVAWPCVAYGDENTCTLCAMINFEHPVTRRTLDPDWYRREGDPVYLAVAAQLERSWGLSESQKRDILAQ